MTLGVGFFGSLAFGLSFQPREVSTWGCFAIARRRCADEGWHRHPSICSLPAGAEFACEKRNWLRKTRPPSPTVEVCLGARLVWLDSSSRQRRVFEFYAVIVVG
ncbi:unnamed protein product [Ostreobium quekettii]|uniref:Uncharacterized protein n=1 Tax=Ostreobium quekettii TaxID=121088 RepID=A0A8S1IKJ9_9CHLO|nr:unnamed protein product [Ostreobium quekettii]